MLLALLAMIQKVFKKDSDFKVSFISAFMYGHASIAGLLVL